MRLLIAYIAAEDSKPTDKDELLDAAGLSSQEAKTVENISLLGVSLEKVIFTIMCSYLFTGYQGSRDRVQEAKQKRKGKNTDEEVPYAVSRYVPVLKRLLQVGFAVY
jgi:hypothetical protein